ncbi:MAG: ECF transporter S component [Lachnospiraceae bacterium]
MKKSRDTKFVVAAAMLAALTCIATIIIKIPTPTFGYIHLGDGFVLLCGILLGPLYGALSAGIGSMFADLFSGYIAFAPATFVIKAVTALIASILFRLIKKIYASASGEYAGILIAGVTGEAFMVIGYFVFEIFLAMIAAGQFTNTAFAAGVSSSATGIPFNIVQGFIGIVITALLLPLLKKIPDVRAWINAE